VDGPCRAIGLRIAKNHPTLDSMYKCTYNDRVEFEWDIQKASSNFKKHGVDFADAATIFEDDSAVTALDDCADEERFVTIGMDSLSRVLIVVYTWRNDRIRIISTRKATSKERRQYEG
jgi:hypothetical protein